MNNAYYRSLSSQSILVDVTRNSTWTIPCSPKLFLPRGSRIRAYLCEGTDKEDQDTYARFPHPRDPGVWLTLSPLEYEIVSPLIQLAECADD